MKRYWLFNSPEYKAIGGMEDFDSDYDTLEEAKDAQNKINEDKNKCYIFWNSIYDSHENVIIHKNGLLTKIK